MRAAKSTLPYGGYTEGSQLASLRHPDSQLSSRVHVACPRLERLVFIAEQPAPAPHLAHPEGCAALRIVLVTVPRVSHSCEHFPDGFDLHRLASFRHAGSQLGSKVHLAPRRCLLLLGRPSCYRGTSLIRKRIYLGPCSRTICRIL